MSNQNPYSAPVSDVEIQENTLTESQLSGEIKMVPFFSAFDWLGKAWPIFTAHWLIWSVMALIFVIILAVISVIPIVGAIIQTPLTTLLTAGFVFSAWKVASNGDLEIGDMFTGFSQRFGALTVVGFLSVIVSFVYMLVSALIVFGSAIPMETILSVASGNEEAMMELANNFDMTLIPIAVVAFLGLGILVGALFLFVAPLLMQHKEVTVLQAITMSFKGTLKNLHVLIVAYILMMFIGFAGFLCLVVGILPAMALCIIIMYQAYRSIYVE